MRVWSLGGKIPWGGNGKPLKYSCLDNSMDREAWWATVHGVEKSQTWLKWLSMHNESCEAKYSLWCLGHCSGGWLSQGCPAPQRHGQWLPTCTSQTGHPAWWGVRNIGSCIRKNHLFWHLGILGRVGGRIKWMLGNKLWKELNSYWHFQWTLS